MRVVDADALADVLEEYRQECDYKLGGDEYLIVENCIDKIGELAVDADDFNFEDEDLETTKFGMTAQIDMTLSDVYGFIELLKKTKDSINHATSTDDCKEAAMKLNSDADGFTHLVGAFR